MKKASEQIRLWKHRLLHYACHIRQKKEKNCYCDTRDFPNFHCMSNCRQNRKTTEYMFNVEDRKEPALFVVAHYCAAFLLGIAI